MSAVLRRIRKRHTHSLIAWLGTDDHPRRRRQVHSVYKQLSRGQISDYLNCDHARVELQSAGVTWKQILRSSVQNVLDGIEINLLREILLSLMPQLHELRIGMKRSLVYKAHRPGGTTTRHESYQQKQCRPGRRLFNA